MARQTFNGLVVSSGKMNKTIKVRVQRIKFNRVISKNIVHYRDFLVHDELNKCKEGDVVRIQYVRPLSARKSFAVIEIMKDKGTEFIRYQEEAPSKVAKEELQRLEEYKQLRQQKLQTNGVDPVTEGLRRMELVELSESSKESAEEKIKQLKETYNIEQWPPTPEMLETNGAKIKAELKKLNIVLTKGSFKAYATDLLENYPEKAEQILKEMGRNGAELTFNIKRNILMTYFARNYNKVEVD